MKNSRFITLVVLDDPNYNEVGTSVPTSADTPPPQSRRGSFIFWTILHQPTRLSSVGSIGYTRDANSLQPEDVMAQNRSNKNESRFRRGTILLFLVSLLSAGSTAALYYGTESPFLYATTFAVPVVSDIVLQAFFAGWIMLEKVRYYWFLASVFLAAALGAIALVSTGISLLGNTFHKSFAGRSIGKLFSAFGMAQLLSARALAVFGLMLYLMDAVVSVALVLALPQTFTTYYLFLMANLLLHLVVLTYLGYCFSARVGGGRIIEIADPEQHGAARK